MTEHISFTYDNMTFNCVENENGSISFKLCDIDAYLGIKSSDDLQYVTSFQVDTILFNHNSDVADKFYDFLMQQGFQKSDFPCMSAKLNKQITDDIEVSNENIESVETEVTIINDKAVVPLYNYSLMTNKNLGGLKQHLKAVMQIWSEDFIHENVIIETTPKRVNYYLTKDGLSMMPYITTNPDEVRVREEYIRKLDEATLRLTKSTPEPIIKSVVVNTPEPPQPKNEPEPNIDFEEAVKCAITIFNYVGCKPDDAMQKLNKLFVKKFGVSLLD